MGKKKNNSTDFRKNKEAKSKKESYILIGVFALLALALVGVGVYGSVRPAPSPDKVADENLPRVKGIIQRPVTIKTTQGDIELDMYPSLMPNTVAYFTKLVDSKYYEGLKFDRVDENLVQEGAPSNGVPDGVEPTIPLETYQDLRNIRGAIAMAQSSDPNSSGPQFYILKKDSFSLDNQNAVFGKVNKGMDVVDKLTKNDKILEITVGKKK